MQVDDAYSWLVDAGGACFKVNSRSMLKVSCRKQQTGVIGSDSHPEVMHSNTKLAWLLLLCLP